MLNNQIDSMEIAFPVYGPASEIKRLLILCHVCGIAKV